MTAAPARDYDLKMINIDDSNLANPADWSFRSALYDQVEYNLMSREPLEYFDFKQRYLVK